jgi:hypothetical protein
MPRTRVETTPEEKEEASMDIDAGGTAELTEVDRQLGAGRPNDLLLPSAVINSGREMKRSSPGPALATEPKNADVLMVDPSVRVDSSANNIGAPSQPDWMYMTTQAPHGSLSDL